MGSKLNPVIIVLRGVDRVTGTVSKVSTRLRAMQKPVRDLSRAFSDLNKNSGFSKVMEKAQGVGTSLARLARNALFVGSALGVAAVAGMAKFIRSADSLDEAAASAGLTVEELQELRFAAERSGIPTEMLDQSMRKFAQALGLVRLKAGPLNTLLKKNAPALLAQFRAAKTTGEGFDILTRAAKGLTPQMRNVLVAAAFGKAGLRVGRMLDDVEELRQRARDLGIVLSEATVKQAVKAQDSLEDLGFVGKGLAMVFASELLPLVIELTQRITTWVESNRELIRTEIPKFAQRVAEQVREMATWLAVAIPKVVSFVDKIGGLKTVLAALAVFIMGPLLTSIFALSAAIIVSPFGWLLLVIAAVIGAVAALIIYWDDLTSAVGRFADKVRSIPGFSQFGEAAPWATEAFSGRPSLISPDGRDQRKQGDLSRFLPGSGVSAPPNGLIRLEASGFPFKLKEMKSSGVDLEFLRGPLFAGEI